MILQIRHQLTHWLGNHIGMKTRILQSGGKKLGDRRLIINNQNLIRVAFIAFGQGINLRQNLIIINRRGNKSLSPHADGNNAFFQPAGGADGQHRQMQIFLRQLQYTLLLLIVKRIKINNQGAGVITFVMQQVRYGFHFFQPVTRRTDFFCQRWRYSTSTERQNGDRHTRLIVLNTAIQQRDFGEQSLYSGVIYFVSHRIPGLSVQIDPAHLEPIFRV